MKIEQYPDDFDYRAEAEEKKLFKQISPEYLNKKTLQSNLHFNFKPYPSIREDFEGSTSRHAVTHLTDATPQTLGELLTQLANKRRQTHAITSAAWQVAKAHALKKAEEGCGCRSCQADSRGYATLAGDTEPVRAKVRNILLANRAWW